jgi:tetratricopeptide (TPR) repeat protein
MNPKEFYQNNLPEARPSKSVLGLFPDESASFFQDEIFPSILDGDSEIRVTSYKDTSIDNDILKSIFQNIQNASVIITDVTGFTPNVMYELGIALLKNDKHIIIANENCIKQLPFYLNNIQIKSYSLETLPQFKQWLNGRISELIPEIPHHCSFSRAVNENVARIRHLVSHEIYDTALELCDHLKQKEPDNCCVEELWVEILMKAKKYDLAKEKYGEILQYKTISRSLRSKIIMKQGELFLIPKPKRIEEALICYEQADRIYNRNPELYEKWAYACHLIQNHGLAYEKMEIARNLDPTNQDYVLKTIFYNNWRIIPDYNMGLKAFFSLQNKTLGKTTIEGKRSPIDSSINEYERFKKTIKLNTLLKCKLTAVLETGIQFKIYDRNTPSIYGFVHKSHISEPNFHAIYRTDDDIMIEYTGFKDERQSIFGKNIQKI